MLPANLGRGWWLKRLARRAWKKWQPGEPRRSFTWVPALSNPNPGRPGADPNLGHVLQIQASKVTRLTHTFERSLPLGCSCIQNHTPEHPEPHTHTHICTQPPGLSAVHCDSGSTSRGHLLLLWVKWDDQRKEAFPEQGRARPHRHTPSHLWDPFHALLHPGALCSWRLAPSPRKED